MLSRDGKHGGDDTSSWREAMSQSPPKSHLPEHAQAQSPGSEGYLSSVVTPLVASTNPWTAAAKEARTPRMPPSQPQTRSQTLQPSSSMSSPEVALAGYRKFSDPPMKLEEVSARQSGKSTPAEFTRQQSVPGGHHSGHTTNYDIFHVDTHSHAKLSGNELISAIVRENALSSDKYRSALASAKPTPTSARVPEVSAEGKPSLATVLIRAGLKKQMNKRVHAKLQDNL